MEKLLYLFVRFSHVFFISRCCVVNQDGVRLSQEVQIPEKIDKKKRRAEQIQFSESEASSVCAEGSESESETDGSVDVDKFVDVNLND